MRFFLLLCVLFSSLAQAVPLDTAATFASGFPYEYRRGQPVAIMARGSGTNAMYMVEVDPTTGALPVSGTITATNPSVGATGAAVPASATYVCLNFGGNCTGLTGTANGLKVDVQASVLPTGAATGTKQDAGNTSLSSIDTKLTSQATAAKQDTGNTSLASIDSKLTNPLPVSGTVSSTQGTSPWVVSGTVAASNLPTTVDTNYGTVGSSTPRSAAQVGNASGAADFNSGAATAQTLRSVLATRHETVSTPLAAQLSNGTNAVDYNSGAAGAATLRSVLATRHEAVATPLAAQLSNGTTAIDYGAGAVGTATVRTTSGGRDITKTIVASNNYASTNVTTSAYVQLIASTANIVEEVCVSDSSGSIIKVATGGAGVEVDRIYLPAGASGCYNLHVPASTRISLEALDATASTGYFTFTGLP